MLRRTTRGGRESEPDDLDEAAIARAAGTSVPWRIRILAETDSTNDRVLDLARAGAPEGCVVIADAQSAGRGRRGRRWASPRGVNLYLSVLLRPEVPLASVSPITLLAAVAVAEAVERAAEVRPAIKWPNDLLLNGRKVAGILTELELGPGDAPALVVGIGVNLNAPRDAFPPELRRIATSLWLATGRRVSRPGFAGLLLRSLAAYYERYQEGGFEVVRRRWESYCALRGKRVRIEGAGPSLCGVMVGVDGEGALLLEERRAVVRRVLAGDVTVVGGCGRERSLGDSPRRAGERGRGRAPGGG